MRLKRILSSILQIYKSKPGEASSTIPDEVAAKLRNDLSQLPKSNLTPELPENANAKYANKFIKFLEANERNDQDALATLREEDSFLYDIYKSLLLSYKTSELSSEPIKGVFRRSAFRNITHINGVHNPRTIMDQLPRVGLFHYPHMAEVNFLRDVFSGIASIEILDPGEIASIFWNNTDIDFESYLSQIRKSVEYFTECLDASMRKVFPSNAWLVDELTQQTFHQIAFATLLRNQRWQFIVAGALELEFGMLLHDFPSKDRPPIYLMYHGLLGGTPVTNIFQPAEKVIARGKSERDYYLDIGRAESSILQIGSISIDAFPSQQSFRRNRETARDRLGISSDQIVIFYALTYDFGIYPSALPPKSVTEKLLRAFEILMSEKGDFKEAVILMKYHPSPGNERFFTYSSYQYPLEDFAPLSCYGYRIRLVNSFDDLPGSDCFISHESTALFSALENGIGTVSINLNTGDVKSILGTEIQYNSLAHRQVHIGQSADTIAEAISQILLTDPEVKREDSEKGWRSNFEIGRTDSIIKLRKHFGQLFKENSKENKCC